jgi:hypothetical protein
MKISFLNIILLFLIIFKSFGHGNFSFYIPCNPYIDKLFTENDKKTIQFKKVKLITIYQSTLCDSGFTAKIKVGEIFFGDTITHYESLGNIFEYCLPMIKTIYKKNKIICFSGCNVNGSSCNQYRQINYLDKSGKIIKTKNLLISKPRFEDEFYYTSIEYKYINDLLSESIYINSWRYKNKNQIYKKLYFDYQFK